MEEIKKNSWHRGKRQQVKIFCSVFFLKVESKIERIMFKIGDNFIPATAAQGTLVRLKGNTLEMLIWFVLHEQCKFEKKIVSVVYVGYVCGIAMLKVFVTFYFKIIRRVV